MSSAVFELEQLRVENVIFRRLLWAAHAIVDHGYGDDGELQWGGRCDFKRDSARHIEAAIQKRGWEKAVSVAGRGREAVSGSELRERSEAKQAEALRELMEAARSAVRILEVACFEGDAEILRDAIRRYEEAQRG